MNRVWRSVCVCVLAECLSSVLTLCESSTPRLTIAPFTSHSTPWGEVQLQLTPLPLPLTPSALLPPSPLCWPYKTDSRPSRTSVSSDQQLPGKWAIELGPGLWGKYCCSYRYWATMIQMWKHYRETISFLGTAVFDLIFIFWYLSDGKLSMCFLESLALLLMSGMQCGDW